MKIQSRSLTRWRHGNSKVYQVITICLLLLVLLSAVPALKVTLNASPYIPPLYWGSILFATSILFPQIHVPGRISQKDRVLGYAITGAVMYLAIFFIVGVLTKSLKGTPYDNSMHGVLYNLAIIAPAVLARETIRAYAIGTAARTMKHKLIGYVLITIILIIPEISLTKMVNIKNTEALLTFIVRDFLPIISKNILLSVLVYYGGAKAGITYRGIQDLFMRTFPFIPELAWLFEGSLSVMYTLFYAFYVHEINKNIKDQRRQKEEKDAGFVVALVMSVLFAWFCVGVFTLYPSVVLTGSMEPVIYPGDVIIIRKMFEEKEVNELVEGDVITFSRLDYTVTHRIKEVQIDEAGNRSFVTKGDNNKSEDQEIVKPNDIKGIVVRVVPKVGLPILIARSQQTVPEGVIDYEEQLRE